MDRFYKDIVVIAVIVTIGIGVTIGEYTSGKTIVQPYQHMLTRG